MSMDTLFSDSRVWAGIVAGLVSHNAFFIRGEHHLQAPILLRLGLAIYAVLLLIGLRTGFRVAMEDSLFTLGSFATALFTSMTVYRLVFHPLRSFNGPLLNRTSKLWHLFNVRDSSNQKYLDGLHKQYGTIVRTGPSELTVFHPEVFNVIGGPGTSCKKAAWYDMLYPLVALNSIREKTGYAPRRSKWDQALKTTAIRNEEVKIIKYATQLADALQSFEGRAVVVNDWFSFFSFDVMGDLAFDKSFKTLATGEWHSAVTLLRDGMDCLGLATPVPWLAQIAFSLPGAAYSWNAMITWCKSTMSERLVRDVEKRDVSYWLMEAAKQDSIDGTKLDMDALYGDAVAMIIAGSHTVSTTLLFIFQNMARNATIQDKLRAEVQSNDWRSDLNVLKDLIYLGAVINETLRLHPVVPTGGIRMTGAEGVHIAGHYIPPETTIVAPRYTISRLESCFEQAEKFIPERWTTKPEMIKDQRAFNPFNLGRHSCPGKNLGLLEVRFVTALLLSQFEVSFAHGEDGLRSMGDLKDYFTARPGKLELLFQPRETVTQT